MDANELPVTLRKFASMIDDFQDERKMEGGEGVWVYLNASRNVHRLAAEISRHNWKDDRKEMSALIHAAKACQIAANKEELISLLFGKKIASKRDAEIAWNVNAELSSIDGPTGSAWGIVNALTRMSQFSPYMADRTDMDASAGKILSFVSNWMGKGSLY